MADLLGSMRVEIVGDNRKLDKSIDDTKKKTDEFGKSTAGLGASLSGLFTGIGFALVTKELFDLGKQAEDLFQIQETAEAKLDATLKATGEAAGLTAEQLKTMASELQQVTTFGDEATIGAQSLLLTFKDVGENVFPRALESILDVSTAMEQDLKSSTIQIGKALNDPVAGLAALSRVGIQFSDVQKDLIKDFQESGDLASAQGVILEELESQFGGVARAAALTAEGIEKQLNNSYGDLLETIGEVISKGLSPYRQGLIVEVETINKNIKAHILRKKALEGNATLIEELTLKQLEQEKAEKALAQAVANIDAAENRVLDTRNLSEQQILRIEAATAAAIEQGKETVKRLEDELTATQFATAAANRALDAENQRIEANILLAQGIDETTESTEENAETTVLSIEEIEKAEKIAAEDRASRREQEDTDILERLEARREANFIYFDAIKEKNEEAAEAEAKAVEDAEERKQAARQTTLDLISSGFNVIDQLADNAAQAELDRLEKAGASEEELDAKKKELAKENATRERAAAIFDIGVNTATAIVKALTLGPIAGPIAAGIIGGLAAAQVTAVLTTPLPKFADGGIVAGNQFVGDKVPVMADSGEMFINRKDQQSLLRFIQSGSQGSVNNNNSSNININSIFSLGNDAKINEAAERLFPALQKVSARRGASIGGI